MFRGAGAALVAGGLAACAPGNTPGGKSLPSTSATKPPSGEITIWDRTGDLYKVFDKAIASF
ncbi:MAG: sugar ABC transporter substrate-binding protein, partial [Kribbellaceae bacterium]|nr:sugar ABC transporter substrate-binding protein [Kribbellaceae bacterium]